MAASKPTSRDQSRRRVKFRSRGLRISGRDISTAERLLVPGSGRFPADYTAFLLRHNDATPDPSAFEWKHPKFGAIDTCVEGFLGIDRSSMYGVHQPDLISQTLRHRHDIPTRFVPIGYTGGHDILLLAVDDSHRTYGQVWIKYMNERGISRIGSKPDLGVYRVARSFKEFIGSLKPYEEGV
jgi:hypothetical protein